MSFLKGFEKVAKLSTQAKERLGLGILGVPAAYQTAKGVKEKDPTEAAMGATEIGGLGVLMHAIEKAHTAKV